MKIFMRSYSDPRKKANAPYGVVTPGRKPLR